MIELTWCPVCADETAVDLLPCPDSDGMDGLECAERVCASCSTAVFAGLVIAVRRAA